MLLKTCLSTPDFGDRPKSHFACQTIRRRNTRFADFGGLPKVFREVSDSSNAQTRKIDISAPIAYEVLITPNPAEIVALAKLANQKAALGEFTGKCDAIVGMMATKIGYVR